MTDHFMLGIEANSPKYNDQATIDNLSAYRLLSESESLAGKSYSNCTVSLKISDESEEDRVAKALSRDLQKGDVHKVIKTLEAYGKKHPGQIYELVGKIRVFDDSKWVISVLPGENGGRPFLLPITKYNPGPFSCYEIDPESGKATLKTKLDI